MPGRFPGPAPAKPPFWRSHPGLGRLEPPRLRAWSEEVLTGTEIPFEPCSGSRLERVEAREGRLEGSVTVADAFAPRVEQANRDRAAAHLPGLDEAAALELANEVTDLGQRVGESPAQDPVHPSLGVDEPTCVRRLMFHRDVIPRDTDTPALCVRDRQAFSS